MVGDLGSLYRAWHGDYRGNRRSSFPPGPFMGCGFLHDRLYCFAGSLSTIGYRQWSHHGAGAYTKTWEPARAMAQFSFGRPCHSWMCCLRSGKYSWRSFGSSVADFRTRSMVDGDSFVRSVCRALDRAAGSDRMVNDFAGCPDGRRFLCARLRPALLLI